MSLRPAPTSRSDALAPRHPALYAVRTHAAGAPGRLPLTDELLRSAPSGDVFGLSQNVGMGWEPARSSDDPVLILSTQGGIRRPDGSPVALGYHTGHWELGRVAETVADEVTRRGGLPFAATCSDPCDGRSQGTTAMFDSLPYRNDAAIVLRRLIRSLPRRVATVGIATCDKGLPAMMMALAGTAERPAVLIPGGVTLPPTRGEDAGSVQTLGARYSLGLVTLAEAAALGCVACATPGGGCQFLGTAASAQVAAEALGMSVTHSALAPSGEPAWFDAALRSVDAVLDGVVRGSGLTDVLTSAAVTNTMAVLAAFGASTNLLLHLPAVAHAAGLRRPRSEDWTEVVRRVPRLVSVLPNGPEPHPTVSVFLAGGVPEVMLHLRDQGHLDLEVVDVTGRRLGDRLEEWRTSERRRTMRDRLSEDGVDPDRVILPPARSRGRGLRPTMIFPVGNLAPEGAVVKATSIDARLFDAEGIYRFEGTAVVFTSERAAVAAARSGAIEPGHVVALVGCGPLGTGMEETYQLTSALKALPYAGEVALITDARFSGASTGACVGHVGPEALAGGPIGRLRTGDRIRIVLDSGTVTGRVDLVGDRTRRLAPDEAAEVLARRDLVPGAAPDPALPSDTRLWAALQSAAGGVWGGCVYDADSVLDALAPQREAVAR